MSLPNKASKLNDKTPFDDVENKKNKDAFKLPTFLSNKSVGFM